MAMSDSAYERVVAELKATQAHHGYSLRDLEARNHFRGFLQPLSWRIETEARYRADVAELGPRAAALYERTKALTIYQVVDAEAEMVRGWAKRIVVREALSADVYRLALDEIEAAVITAEQRPQ